MAGRMLFIGFSFLLSCTLFFSSCEEVTVSLVSDASKTTFCPGEVVTFTCRTSGGALLWETSTTSDTQLIRSITDGPTNLGIFRLTVAGVLSTPGPGQSIVEAINSSATTLVGVRPADDGIRLGCRQTTNFTLDQVILRVTGPPPAPTVNPITVVDEGSINSSATFLVSWNESNCAVQYVVTSINSSDDRVYPNITTSNTNTTVTLPTGVEFCVTLVAVDSIGRRGPDTTPVCYQFSNMLSTTTTATILQNATSATTTVFVSSSVLVVEDLSAAAVAIPVVLVVLLLVIGVVVLGMGLYIYYWKKGHTNQCTVQLSSFKSYNKTVEVFCREVDINKWEIACVVGIPKENADFLNAIKKHLENDKFTACASSTVNSVEENVHVSIQNCNEDWNAEEVQGIQPEDIVEKCETKFTTKTFMVSSSRISPDDMCVSVTINGGQTPHIVERKASKRCSCQVFYYKEGINWWKIIFTFFPNEHTYNKVKEFYKDLEAGPIVYFYIWHGAETIDLHHSCKTDWRIVEEYKIFQVSRAAILGYTGESSPPSCEMAFKTVSDTLIRAPNLSLSVTFTGVKKQNKELQIERPGEVPAWYVCQVFYHMDNINDWKVTLAFWHKKKFNLSEMKKFYQNAEIGSVHDINFNSIKPSVIAPIKIQGTDELKLVSFSQVQKEDIVGYTGEGKPPCIVMTLRAASDEDTPPNLQLSITLSGVDGVIKLSMTRKTK